MFELSKEYKSLPTDEIISCLKSENIKFDIIESNDDILLLKILTNSKILKTIPDRLSLTHCVNKLLFVCSNSLSEIKENAKKTILKEKGTISVRVRNRSNNTESQKIVKVLAEIYTKNRTVNLDNPDQEIRCLITDDKVYVGLKIASINRNQFEKRKVQFRPFFSPISLHPKLARALINLSAINKNQILLDPFCGTGGILLEAGLMGIKVIGSDIEDKMIEGCKKTLDFYKIKNYKLYCSDIGDIRKHIRSVDAIVTDMPYGKSTTTKGEKMEELYKRAFQSMSKILKKGGKSVVGISNKNFISLGEKCFSVIKKYEFKVHRSLIRYFIIYEK